MNDPTRILRDMTKAAVRRTLAALRHEYPAESLAGYALLTDDALETLSYLAVTKEALTSTPDSELLFCPTDWPYGPEEAAFEGAGEQLRLLSRTIELRLHVDRAFAALVQALSDLRAESAFPAEVFLSVLSTDPSPYLDALETAAIKRLNGTALVRQRELFIERWRR